MECQSTGNWLILIQDGLLLLNLIALVVYVCFTRRISIAANEQTAESRMLAKWQRQQWQLDSRKQEWMELVGALTRCAQKIIDARSNVKEIGGVWDPYLKPAKQEGERIISDRLFISDSLERNKIKSDWESFNEVSLERTEKEPEVVELGRKLSDCWNNLRHKLMELAKADLNTEERVSP